METPEIKFIWNIQRKEFLWCNIGQWWSNTIPCSQICPECLQSSLERYSPQQSPLTPTDLPKRCKSSRLGKALVCHENMRRFALAAKDLQIKNKSETHYSRERKLFSDKKSQRRNNYMWLSVTIYHSLQLSKLYGTCNYLFNYL